MSRQGYILRQWPVTYYMPEGKRWLAKKWVTGVLAVSANGIKFIASLKKGEVENRVVDVPFTEFAELKKSTSALLYSAVVIETKENSHWFSSLPSRDAAYAVIEHFWRERLIPTTRKVKKGGKEGERTALGTGLLRLTEDSEKTLQGAGVMLKHQGEQLDHATGVMYDMHNDLAIAERIISGFEGWLGNWRLPKVYRREAIEIIDSKNVPTVYDFPVVFKHEGGTSQNLTSGSVRLSKDGITIMDYQQINVHHYNRRDVSSVRVISPWEVTISRYNIGQPDVSFTVLSTHMVEILKALEPLYRDKFDLMEPPKHLERGTSTEASSPASSVCTESGEISPPPLVQPISLSSPLVLLKPSSQVDSASGQLQVQEEARKEVVSEAEAEELSEMLARMKHMASDIANEQDSQMDKIDALTETVERANDRLKSDTSRVKRLF